MSFEKIREKLLEGLSEDRRRVAEVHLRNAEKILVKDGMLKEGAEEGGPTAVSLSNNDVAHYGRVMLPVIRRVADALLAQELV